jgi:hypothetical protein
LYFDNRKSKFNIITLVILLSVFYLFYHSSYSLTPFLTIFQLYCGVQCYWWRKLECPEKTTNLSQVTDKTLSHDVASSTPHLSGNRTHNLSGDMQHSKFVIHQLEMNNTHVHLLLAFNRIPDGFNRIYICVLSFIRRSSSTYNIIYIDVHLLH